MRPLQIYLGDLTYTTLSIATEAFPLNVGFVGAYCKERYGNDVQITPFKYIEDLDEAIRLDPKNATAYFIRGFAYKYLGQHERANQDYDEANRLNPNLKRP